MKNYLKKLFALSDQGAKDLYYASILTTVINIFIMIMSGVAFYFVQESLLPIMKGQAPIYSLLFYIAYSLLILGIIAIGYYFQYNALFIGAYDESANIRINLAETIRKLPLSFFGKKDLTDLTTTMMNDVTMMEQAFSHYIPVIIGSFISTTIMAIAMFVFDWRIALALCWVIPISYFICFTTRKLQDFQTMRVKKEQLACESKVQECIENIKDMKANNRTSAHLEIMENRLTVLEKILFKSEIGVGIYVVSAQMILKVGIATTMIVCTILLAQNEINLLTFITFLIIATRIYDPLAAALINLAATFMALKSVDRMKELQETPIQKGSENTQLQSYTIVFDDVHFSYNNNEKVLERISFTAKQGEVTALVGPSGGGKSTAMKLAARFWDVTQGKITIGDEDISAIEPEALLKYISVVFQDVTLFNNTVMENIRIGRKGASDEEVVEAAKNAQCHDFIMQLPDGYNTLIGENGSTLSGGERQRLSIARALLKDAPIVLLDEATSSLDIHNESAVQEAISRLTKNKTVIVIAHRMRTIAGANSIILLKEGKVQAQGTHSILLENSSDYKRMIELQTQSLQWSL